MKKNIVIISGAGISAESGIPTFRDTDGIWEKYNPEKVASKWAWINDKSKVLDFLNLMRREVLDKGPNEAHYIIADLERIYNVDIITTNIDDFHEKAGSTKVLHLHGEILKTRSSKNPNIKYDDTV
ncbi:MAG: NAD-dependent protein deacylase, partial [Lachnospiraceae bacterium]|nr:NAD-dependent protein deacylase [Lachnospiraceae bacterium]